MRLLASLVLLFWCSEGLALDNNQPETWPSPDGKYEVREAFYGQGKRVIGQIVNRATGDQTPVYDPGGARSLFTLWSPDSHFVAINADSSKYAGLTALYRVEHGLVTKVQLPKEMEAVHFLSQHAQKNLGHLAFHSIRAIRWHTNRRIEFVAETEAVLLGDAGVEDVARHFILEILPNKVKILKSFCEG